MQEVIVLGLFIFAVLFIIGFILKVILIFVSNPKLLSLEDIEFKKKFTIFNKKE